RGPAGRGGARAVHVHADLERLPLAVLGAHQGRADRAAVAGAAVERLLLGLRPDLRRYRAGDAAAAAGLRPVRTADHRRNHGRCAEGMTEELLPVPAT